MMGYLFVFVSIAFTVSSQLLIKWRLGVIYPGLTVPEDFLNKMFYLFVQVILDPVIIFCLFCSFMSGVAWMAAMTKLPISVAYPLTSLGYVLVLVLSFLLLGESFNFYKLAGVVLIMAGIAVSSQG